jgi:hypothetical protein
MIHAVKLISALYLILVYCIDEISHPNYLSFEVVIAEEGNPDSIRNEVFVLKYQYFHQPRRQQAILAFCHDVNLPIDSCQSFEAAVEQRLVSYVDIPNKHFDRFEDAVNGEVQNIEVSRYVNALGIEVTVDEELTRAMRSAADEIVHQLTSIAHESSKSEQRRIVFIHSCALKPASFNILNGLLHNISESGLIDQLDGVWILNYGHQLSYEHLAVSSDHQDGIVHIINISLKTHYFEVPTLAILHQVSRSLAEDLQVLYLHSKGVSYKTLPPPIFHWTNMMMYHLVHMHQSWYYLLLSGEFDVIGCEYSSKDRFLSGNFFWTRSRYAATLQPLEVTSSNKYDAEKWILSGKQPRIYVPFNSGANLNDYDIGERYLPLQVSGNSRATRFGAQSQNDEHMSSLLSYRNSTHCIGRMLAS